MSKVRKKTWGYFFPEYELRRREIGFKRKIGWEGNIKYKLYSSLHPCNSWDPVQNFDNFNNSGIAHHGGIFNLEFSPDGKQLVAACEKKSIMIFDPISRKLVCNVSAAHSSCVNGIKFLDNRVFASCSDDKTVALWDVRNLKRKIKSLYGHNNWVKNIEYSSEDGLLVSSGFDGKILGWNINKYSEENGQFSELFKMQGLMRIKFTPDFSKLVICTTGGYMLMVHNLSLRDLPKDFAGFKPQAFRQLHMLDSSGMQVNEVNAYFQRQRNRLEFINDFPPENLAEVIHSLQVHPQAWCVLSRNTSVGDISEWTCVHDIQDIERNNNKESTEEVPEAGKRPRIETDIGSANISVNSRMEIMLRQNASTNTIRQERRQDQQVSSGASEGQQPSENSNPPWPLDVFQFIERYGRMRRELLITPRNNQVVSETDNGAENISSNRPENGESSSAASSNQDFRLRQRRLREGYAAETPEDFRSVFFIMPQIGRSLLLLDPLNCENPSLENFQEQKKAFKSVPRLTNYVEEPNKGKGFIKELCFSSDGRLICSPFDCGVRLMMFDDKCSELSHCVQEEPQQLRVISSNICHSNCVVSTKFSPTDCLLVSGCLNGKIVWHQPIL